MVLPKLAASNLLAHRMRAALTIAAIAFSVSLVVSVTSGYASLEEAAYHFFTRYLGGTDVTFSPAQLGSGVPESLVDQVRKDPRVKLAVGRLEINADRGLEVIGVRMPDDPQVGQLNLEAGQWFDSPDGDTAVIDQGMAEQKHLAPGESLTLTGLGDETLRLKIVGVIHKPDVMARLRSTVYVPLHTLQRFKKDVGRLSRVSVTLRDSRQANAFGADWENRLRTEAPTVRVRLTNQSRETVGRNLESIHLLSYMGGLVSMVAALFIVFSALAMGVTERQRTLAVLRAVGAFRGQVAALVVIEGLLIGVCGAVIGAALGWTWIHLLVWKFPNAFTAGAIMSRGGLIFGVGGALLAALAASLLPAWSASRVTPLEAMTPMARPPSDRAPLLCALIGLLLVCIDPLVLYGPTERILTWMKVSSPHATARAVRFYVHFGLGLPAVMAGFFLLSPLFVRIVETCLAPIVAPLLGLRVALLRRQLSGGIWRAAGTATALMVGLAALVSLQTEGTSMLRGWSLPDRFPDVFIADTDLTGIDLNQAKKLEDVPGIRRGEVMPIAIVSPGLPANFLGFAGMMFMPDRTMFIGIDPSRAFKLMQLDFRQGNAKDARRLLSMGRHILVTTEFQQLRGLGLGDKVPLQTIHGWRDYTIAGVVWSPGIDVMVTLFDMGTQMDQRTAASVFGTDADAERDFGVSRFVLFAANLEYFTDKQAVLRDVRNEFRRQGMRIGDIREIKYHIDQWFGNLLLLVSTVAFAAMAVAALGVTNTVMAGIRSRRWQFGVLRGIGLTRMQLLRLVLAEAILLGLIGCALGILCGLELSWNAQVVGRVINGYQPPMIVSWRAIVLGGGIIVTISVLAGAWPAILVALAEPLQLLQAGRAST